MGGLVISVGLFNGLNWAGLCLLLGLVVYIRISVILDTRGPVSKKSYNILVNENQRPNLWLILSVLE